MITKMRVGAKFLFTGLVLGLILAPRSGKESRQQFVSRAVEVLSDILDIDFSRYRS